MTAQIAQAGPTPRQRVEEALGAAGVGFTSRLRSLEIAGRYNARVHFDERGRLVGVARGVPIGLARKIKAAANR